MKDRFNLVLEALKGLLCVYRMGFIGEPPGGSI